MIETKKKGINFKTLARRSLKLLFSSLEADTTR